MRAPGQLDPGAGRQREGAPAVAVQHGGRPGRVDLDRHLAVRRDDHRPGEQRVRVARHQQQRLHLRPDDRPARGERVRGGAGRGGAQDAVAAERGQRPAVDLQHHLQHPLADALLHGGLVERPGPGEHVAVGAGHRVDGHPLLDLRTGPRRSRPGWRPATPARPRPGTRPGPGSPRAAAPRTGRAISAARSSVPSPPSTSTTSAPSAQPGRPSTMRGSQPVGQVAVAHLGPLLGQHPQPDAGRGQPAGDGRPRCAGWCPGPTCRTSSTSRVTAAPPRPRSRSAAVADVLAVRGRAAGSTRRCRTGRAAGWPPRRAAPGRAPAPPRRPRPARPAAAPDRAPPRPQPSRSRPTSNCGLTIGSSSPSGGGAGGQRGQHRAQRDERQVGDGELRPGRRSSSGVSVRTLVRSSTRTRSSLRSRQTSWPYPTSTATTCGGARGPAARR